MASLNPNQAPWREKNAHERKIALVTGASRGIGRAIAVTLAPHASHVVVIGRSRSHLDAVVAEIRGFGSEATPWICDVTSKEEVWGLEQEVQRRVGTVQILVNNAGIAPAASFLEMDDSLWEEVLKVNLTGTYYCCKAFLPGMIALRWGRIINIASTLAKVAYPHTAAYTTSKHAVLGLTRALAVETAKAGVTVNAICPGYVDTDLTQKNARLMAAKTGVSVDEAIELFKRACPQNRLILPEEVAGLAVMLASDAAGAITGQAINVDGGAVMA